MWYLNTLAFCYCLEDIQRAAHHDMAEKKHRERTGPNETWLSGLMRIVGAALSPLAGKMKNISNER